MTGSDANPVVLHPENVIAPTDTSAERFATDGTPDPSGDLLRVATSGAVQGDDSFAVPGASGCGLLGLVDKVIDAKVGLPSPAGQNRLELDDASSYLAGAALPAAHTGRDLSASGHSALL
jgi:hypothetical protein